MQSSADGLERQQVEGILDVVVGNAPDGGARHDGRVAEIDEENGAVVGGGGGRLGLVVWRKVGEGEV